MPATRKLARKFHAKPGRRAGNQRDFLHEAFALTIVPGLLGGPPTGSASTNSIPLSTWPHKVYWPSRKVASSNTMKNWLLAECGSDVRAIDTAPRTCGSVENSDLRLGRCEPLVPV